MIRSPQKKTIFVLDVLEMPLLDKGKLWERRECAKSWIHTGNNPYEVSQRAQHSNRTAIKAMVAATLAGLEVRMAEIGKSNKDEWVEVIDDALMAHQEIALAHLQDKLLAHHLDALPDDYPTAGLAEWLNSPAQEEAEGGGDEGRRGGDEGGSGGGAHRKGYEGPLDDWGEGGSRGHSGTAREGKYKYKSSTGGNVGDGMVTRQHLMAVLEVSDMHLCQSLI